MRQRFLFIVFSAMITVGAMGGDGFIQPDSEMVVIGAEWTYYVGFVYQVGEDGKPTTTEDINRTDVAYKWSLDCSDGWNVIGTKEMRGKTYYVLNHHKLPFTTGGGYSYMDTSEYDFFREPPHIEIGIREEGGRVYVDREEYLTLLADGTYLSRHGGRADHLPYEQTEDGELVLYDFNMNVGDKYPSVDGCDDITVTAIETVRTDDGRERRQLQLSNGLHIIEGIGCIDSRGEFLFYLNPSEREQAFVYLRGYMHRSSNPEENKDILFWDILNNWDSWVPPTAVKSVKKDSFLKSSALYDLQGRRLDSVGAGPVPARLRKGVYIENGRKVVVK